MRRFCVGEPCQPLRLLWASEFQRLGCAPRVPVQKDEEGDVLERGLAVCLKRALFRSVKTTKMLMLRAVCLQW